MQIPSFFPYLRIFLCFALLALLMAPAQGQQLDMRKLKNMTPRSIGPAGMSGRVTSIAVVRDQPEVIYIGTASGGLWKSESGGTTWKPIFDKEAVASIGAVAIDPTNSNIIWAGTGEGNPRNSQSSGFGIYKSLDAGKSWKLMGLERTRNIHRVIIDPQSPGTVYAGAQGTAWGETSERGVFKTTDGGKTWKKILYVDEKTGIADLVIDPGNPNKLIAAMWEFRRWPWFFESGGPGSGIYVTQDGGETWKKRTQADGLPKGKLGRIGLAIAPSDPNRVYALIEAKENAFYRSDDGGEKWRKVGKGSKIGNRPFYYADIFVDPKNENRIYSLHSVVTKSEDGGKTFENFIRYSEVHPDHHAWYIHPDDPDFLIDGNDGGMAISRDRGKSWRFVENLPLAQFYHINFDNEYPYNLYGGMQDNGSWRGPAYVWRSGGIRNSYWQELFFGDGFDVVPDPDDSRYGYAMSQGGALGRYDHLTGHVKIIRPIHPEGTDLRFHWNAAIAQDPFDPATIYYGSQFVHKSTDRGKSWTLISPDLTTNDPEKQKQAKSGGLTLDVTEAENHTTILAISPSPVDKNVIWVGTDDGNVQLTRDGGKTWSLINPNIPGMPKGAWVPVIHASNHNSGEAFVIVNNYRQNDWSAYAYYTTNFGGIWRRIVNDEKVWGHALSIVQDPVEPQLVFLGTEYGLYVSLNKGNTWNKWENGFPTVSTIDLKIHPREHDLIIGTFGRAAYILDDITPLREMAASGKVNLLKKEIHLFDPPTGVLAQYRQADGTRFAGMSTFKGKNRSRGLMISYTVREGAKNKKAGGRMGRRMREASPSDEGKMEMSKGGKQKADTVKIEVFDSDGTLIRNFKHLPDTGLNRINWDLRHNGVYSPNSSLPKPGASPPSGARVIPGTYKIKVSYRGRSDSAEAKVIFDPRIEISTDELTAALKFQGRYEASKKRTTAMVRRLNEAKKSLQLIQTNLKAQKDTSLNSLMKKVKGLQDSVKNLMGMIKPPPKRKGIQRSPDLLASKLGRMGYFIGSTVEGPDENREILIKQIENEVLSVMKKVNTFFLEDWKAFQKEIDQVKWKMVKDFPPLE